MASKRLWASNSAAAWNEVQQNLASIWNETTSPKLQELNSWLEAELPGAISHRAPERHITAAELVKLVDWKLTYGKWRPKLLEYAKAAAEEDVRDASSKAIALLLGSDKPAASAAAAAAAPSARKRKAAHSQTSQSQKRAKADSTDAAADRTASTQTPAATAAAAAAAPDLSAVKAAVAALTVLKGVGPATASAVLAAVDSSCPYMGDEALEAACGGRDYTPKAYLQLVEALRGKAAWLHQLSPETGWSAALVERCLTAAALKEKGKPTQPAVGAANNKSAANRSTSSARRKAQGA